jgi:hypothetical protein
MFNSRWNYSSKIERAGELLGEESLRLFLFNKVHESERICPWCMTRYKKSAEDSKVKIEIEQNLSGICSSKCFAQMVGPDEEFEVGEELEDIYIFPDGSFIKGQRVVRDED